MATDEYLAAQAKFKQQQFGNTDNSDREVRLQGFDENDKSVGAPARRWCDWVRAHVEARHLLTSRKDGRPLCKTVVFYDNQDADAAPRAVTLEDVS